MEILYIVSAWVSILYIIHLKKELNTYKKLYNQHSDIYVPSLREVSNQNHWSIQFAKYVTDQLQSRDNENSKIIVPFMRKKLSNIGLVLLPKEKETE